MIDQVLNDIRWLFDHRGSQRHASHRKPDVTQLHHALQIATLAEDAGAGDELVTAAFLHDLGHMMCVDAEDFHGVDDRHEFRALPLLRKAFDESVLGPITLHEDAKRLLSTAEADYFDALTPNARRALMLQGGPFSADEAARFIRAPHAREAILICRWDGRASVRGARTRELDHFLGIARRCMSEGTPTDGSSLLRDAGKSGERAVAV